MSYSSRRGFLKSILIIVSALPFLSVLAKTSDAASASAVVPIPAGQIPEPESDPVASALGFHHDAKKTDFSRYPDRKTPAHKNDFCQYCAQYTSLNGAWGKCNVLTSGLVSARGWCASWTKKSS